MSQTFHFNLPGITCINCVEPVENALRTCDTLSISSYSTDIISKTITITVDDDNHDRASISALLKEAIEDIGVECDEIISMETAPLEKSDQSPAPSQASITIKNKKKTLRTHLIKGVIGLIVGAGLIALTLSGVGLPLAAMAAIFGGSALLTFYLGAESYIDAGKKLVKSRTLTMDSLFAVSTLAIIGVSVASFFIPWLPIMLEAGVLIFGVRHLGKAIEESIKQKIISQATFKDRGAKRVRRKNDDDDDWADCDATNIQEGHIIRVNRGEIIPVDGICLSDHSALYKTILNGNPNPESIRHGDTILAGMRVPDDVSYIEMRANATSAQSYLSRLDQDMSRIKKAPIENTTNKILKYFIPTVFILAAVAGIVVGVLFNPALAIQCAASILVSACPCTLGFITPLAMKLGLSKANENGVQFKNAKALQKADNIDTVIFDLNGTLTTGIPEMTGYELYDHDVSSDQFLSYIGALESKASHPIAHAIATYAGSHGKNKVSPNLTQVDLTNHAGVAAMITDEPCLIGNRQFLQDHDIENIPSVQLSDDNALQIIYFVKNNKVVGSIKITDPLRKDAKFTIDELRRMGKEIHLCTGADDITAKRYARKLGIPDQNICASCVGMNDIDNDHSKTSYIKQLQEQNKRVAMIGDAANDAPALKQSDFGIAVKSADIMTQKNAGAVIDRSSLLPSVTAFAVAKQTMFSIKQNLVLSLAYNMTMILIAGGILIGIGFALNPAIGVALMVAQAALILLNQYRIHRQSLAHVKRFDALNHALGDDSSSTHHITNSLNMRPTPTQHLQTYPDPHAIDSTPSSRQGGLLQASTFAHRATPHTPLLTSQDNSPLPNGHL